MCRATSWPQKSALYIMRTDGNSCSRELVTGIVLAIFFQVCMRTQVCHPSLPWSAFSWPAQEVTHRMIRQPLS